MQRLERKNAAWKSKKFSALLKLVTADGMQLDLYCNLPGGGGCGGVGGPHQTGSRTQGWGSPESPALAGLDDRGFPAV